MSDLPDFKGRLKPVDWAPPVTFSAEKKARCRAWATPGCRACNGHGWIVNQRGDDTVCSCVHEAVLGDLE